MFWLLEKRLVAGGVAALSLLADLGLLGLLGLLGPGLFSPGLVCLPLFGNICQRVNEP